MTVQRMRIDKRREVYKRKSEMKKEVKIVFYSFASGMMAMYLLIEIANLIISH